ncbi:MAG: ABC transporter permease [Tepidisphaerales bacterium]
MGTTVGKQESVEIGQSSIWGHMYFSQLLVFVIVLVIWEILSRFFPLFVGEPGRVVTTLWKWLLDGTLITNFAPTILEVVVGFVLGFFAGVVVGAILAYSPRLARATRPMLDVFNALPRIAMAPLFILAFGLGPASSIALVFSVIVFVILLNTYSGLKTINSDHIRLAQSLGATRYDLVTKIILPSVVPWLLAGIRLSLAYAVSAAVVGEFVSSSHGIGYLMAERSSFLDTSGTYAALLALALFAWLLTGITSFIEKRFTWTEAPDINNPR